MLRLLLIGWITVVSSVGGADVMVDEDDGIRIKGKKICIEVEEGRHLIMVNKEGYIPYIDTLTVHAGVNQSLQIWLEPQANTSGKHKTHPILWDYYIFNGKNKIRWGGIGASIGTGLNAHVTLFNMRFGMFTLNPCLWGINVPLCTDVSHVQTPWLVHHSNKHKTVVTYETAIPSHRLQFYYTPMVGMQIPVDTHMAIVISAAPQISWTKINWNISWRENPFYNLYTFTEDEFPQNGYQFDPIWFSIQTGLLFTNQRSDMLTYFKYQDGYFVGLEYHF